jgi:Fe-S cluster biogenesis protein NfuA
MSVLRRRRRAPADIEHQLKDILAILRIEECALELQDFDASSGTATLLVTGACPDCDASAATFIQGIEAQLKQRVAELQSVLLTAANTS